MIVTFFGHRDTHGHISPVLETLLVELIEDYGADKFYVGDNGNFDRLVCMVLRRLKKAYPDIDYAVVLPEIPQTKREYPDEQTVVPDGMEYTPREYRIARRNRWMVNKSDVVITYVLRKYGGAATYKRYAEEMGKRVINLPELDL